MYIPITMDFNYLQFCDMCICNSTFITSFDCFPLTPILDQHLDQPVHLRLHEQRFQTSFPHITQDEAHGP